MQLLFMNGNQIPFRKYFSWSVREECKWKCEELFNMILLLEPLGVFYKTQKLSPQRKCNFDQEKGNASYEKLYCHCNERKSKV